jgi:hypothetical protein
MIIEFRCKNFLSFKDEVSLNFSTIDSYAEHTKTHLIKNKRDESNLLNHWQYMEVMVVVNQILCLQFGLWIH